MNVNTGHALDCGHLSISEQKRGEGNPRLWQNHVSKITLHNSFSPTLIISNLSARCRGRARPLCARLTGHAGTALAECAGVIARYWITVGIPYVIFFLCIFHKTHARNQNRSITPFSVKPQHKHNTIRIRRRCGCLMTDSAALSIIIIISITITAGSHEHLRGPTIPGGRRSLPLAQRCGVEGDAQG